MAENQIHRLSEVRPDVGAQGLNDGRWTLVEHQLYQVRMSLQTARYQLELIGDSPENNEEWELARSSLEVITPIYTQVLGAIATVKCLLSETKIAERIGGNEDG